ncbi:ATP-binding protein [Cohnella sp. JJ-181]|uniref:GAF domain-containing sensor histidine kinase n=1 Tax=Cohnella rhizoplanae TaxID=2974897 RepID=UPI0022FF8B12|nr:ATP-binding protein [Cohnella sp. JJ-181]CAI6031556.1 Sensor histidine kinase RcsC [Cohnella sp. JJ-181]
MKTDYVDVLAKISDQLYNSGIDVMQTASRLIPANTFCIANLDRVSTVVLNAFNRDKVILTEGLVVANEESYCALVTEKAQGPLIIENNMTHPLTKDMPATQFVGGCSFLGVPVLTPSGQIFGSLCAFDDRFYAFEERDVELLLSLSRFFTNMLALDESVEQLKSAQAQAICVLEEKANLLAVLSHEIRNPMNGVLGMASLLHSTALTEEQKSYVEVIEECGEGLMAMLNQILEHSKVEAGRMPVETGPFDLADCAEQVMQMHAFAAGKKGIVLRLSIDDKLLGGYEGDGLKLRQILVNLVSNAVKFTETGEVVLSVRKEDRAVSDGKIWLSFSVKDTGIGISPERKDQLFRSFSQVHDKSFKDNYGGIGLGLSICRQYAELMGGTVELTDTGPSGTCFTLTVPLYALHGRHASHAG